MNSLITNWFGGSTTKSTAHPPKKKKKKKSLCVISATSSPNNTNNANPTNNKLSKNTKPGPKRKARKRKRSDDEQDPDYDPSKKQNTTTQRTKRRKLSKPQKNNLLSFLSPKPNPTPTRDTPQKTTTTKCKDEASDVEMNTPSTNKKQFTTSRYGRKRKKVNYNLASYWGLPTPSSSQNEKKETEDDEYVMEEEEEEEEPKKTKRQPKNKSKSNRKKEDTADTFFMSKSEKRQYKRDKVMSQFTEEIARRHSEDQRLFGGKKVNPFFEMAKKRQLLTATSTQHKQKTEDTSDNIDLPLFPAISSIQPPPTPRPQIVYGRNGTMDEEFDTEMLQIEKQISHLLYSHSTNATSVDLTVDPAIAVDTPSNVNTATVRYSSFWQSQAALDSYCASADFQNIVQQISREFTDMEHATIEDDLLMCLYRIIDSAHGSSLWCDKYKPFQTVQVVGNWYVANEVKSWLKAWRNAEDKESYLDNDYNYFSDEDEEYDRTLLNIVLLTGPTACGKTASVYAVANELQYTVIEVNCMTIRTGKDLNDQIGEATQSQQVGCATADSSVQRSMVLLEEVDNMLESAPSIIKSISNFVKTSRSPMILTAQHVPPALANLVQSQCLTHFEFSYAPLARLALRTHIIALAEGICITRKEIEQMILFFDYDVRCVWIHLQFWVSSPRTFDHFNAAAAKHLPLPAASNNVDVVACTKENPADELCKLSIHQRIIGCADLSYNSCNRRDRLFWSYFSSSLRGDTSAVVQDSKDNLYCCVQHVLDNPFIHDTVFNSFPFWFMNDVSLNAIKIPLSDVSSSHCNPNPYRYTWTESPAMVEATHVIQSLVDRICGGGAIQQEEEEDEEDVEMKESTAAAEKMEWLDDWCTTIDSLSNNDILEIPRGHCVNASYHDRLHPYTLEIAKDVDLTIEYVECEAHEIYDTIEYEYLKQHIAPYLVTMTVALCSKTSGADEVATFDPQLTDDWKDKQDTNRVHQTAIATSFRRHPVEGNFDFPSTASWFDYYQEFISTICMNEYHREKEGGSQYKHGRALRRSRRNRNTFFEHILDGWLSKDEAQRVVNEWMSRFEGMGWQNNTLPIL